MPNDNSPTKKLRRTTNADTLNYVVQVLITNALSLSLFCPPIPSHSGWAWSDPFASFYDDNVWTAGSFIPPLTRRSFFVTFFALPCDWNAKLPKPLLVCVPQLSTITREPHLWFLIFFRAFSHILRMDAAFISQVFPIDSCWCGQRLHRRIIN